MSRFPRSRRWLVPVAALWLTHAARAQQPPAPESAAPAAIAAPAATPAPAPSVVRFYSPRTVLWLGRTAVIPFQLAPVASMDSVIPAASTAYGVLEILNPPTVLAGQSTGFLRVRGLLPGLTRLVVQGGAAIDLEIKPDPAGAAAARVDPESGRPRIISPSAHAAVWGEFAVGVEVYDRFARPAGPDGQGAANGTRVQLRLPDGRLLDPVTQTGPELGPERHCQFNVPAAELPPGPARLVAVASPAGFTDLDRRSERPGLLLESDALVLDARAVPADAYWSGECEDPEIMGNSKELLAPAHTIANGVSNLNIPETKPDAEASGGKMVACYGGETAWCLPFNVRNPGLYQLFVRTRGDFACGAFPSLGLYLGSTELAAGTVRVSSSRYERLPVGTPVRMEGGPRMFSVVFRNDFVHGKEDRNVYFDRWEVARVGDLPPEPPRENNPARPRPAPPVLTANPAVGLLPKPPDFPALAPLPPAADVLYPANGASVFGLDAAVARIAGGAAHAAWVDLLIDGQPQGERLQGPALADGGPLVFPLLARALTPGSHRLAVRVADAATGQTADAPAREFSVAAQAPAAMGPYARAVFLLDRLAFGPEPRELAAVLTQGRIRLAGRAAGLVLRQSRRAGAPARGLQAVPGNPQRAAVHPPRPLTSGWAATTRCARASRPGAENHFSTWINKTEAESKWREHLAFCRVGIAPFADLLAVSAHSPAMLKYLDQEKSYAGKLNENYAREIMELHTLGVHGGYKQEDVTALAGVLNGWTTTREAVLPQEDDSQGLGLVEGGGNNGSLESTFHFDPLMNDGKAREVFGLRFPATKDPQERHDHIAFALEMLASHPGTAEHVCRKLAEHYVGVPARTGWCVCWPARSWPAAGTCAPCCARWRPSRISGARRRALATPFDFGLRVARLCHDVLPPADAARDLNSRPGQLEGFPQEERHGAVRPRDARRLPGGRRGLRGFQRAAPAVALHAGAQRSAQPAGAHELAHAARRRAVTHAANEPGAAAATSRGWAAVHRPGRRAPDRPPARADSNQSALEVLGQGTPDQMHAALVFIALLPETSLR